MKFIIIADTFVFLFNSLNLKQIRFIGAILVFDVTQRSSFQGVTKWYQEIKGYACDKIQIALVANKIDIDGKRIITTDEVQKIAKENDLAYFETSGKTGQNVDTLFETMAQTILQRIESGEIDTSLEMYGIKVGPGIANVQKQQKSQQDSQNLKLQTGYQPPLKNKKQEGCC
ncbi:unnamed protein product [Paramecium pentaurelia]|uniref:Uncharacterized protein n=1 Tax=Paramecium pentaurelia TaxID=43138 RepID=A0A8S1X7I7_9CILI|nr:unnamed protein product [Paramecium pentaurelia]